MLTEVKIVLAMILVGFMFWAYDEVGDRAVDQYKAEQAVLVAQADKVQRERYNALEGRYEALKSKREYNERVIVKNVEKIVTRDVYRNVCIDDDGLRLINEAISGRNPAKPETEMPPNPTP